MPISMPCILGTCRPDNPRPSALQRVRGESRAVWRGRPLLRAGQSVAVVALGLVVPQAAVLAGAWVVGPAPSYLDVLNLRTSVGVVGLVASGPPEAGPPGDGRPGGASSRAGKPSLSHLVPQRGLHAAVAHSDGSLHLDRLHTSNVLHGRGAPAGHPLVRVGLDAVPKAQTTHSPARDCKNVCDSPRKFPVGIDGCTEHSAGQSPCPQRGNGEN